MKIQDMIDEVVEYYSKYQFMGMCHFINVRFGGFSRESSTFNEAISSYIEGIEELTGVGDSRAYLHGALLDFYCEVGATCSGYEIYEVCLNIYQDWENKPTCKDSLIKMLRSVRGGV